MANLVDALTVRYEADITLAALDNNGVQQERTKTFQYATGVVLYADALNALAALVTALDAINEADTVKYVVRSVFDTLTGAVTAIGNVRKEAILTLRIAGSSKKEAHSIYSPADANVSGNSFVANAAVQTYLDIFETGGDFTISDGEQISTDEPTRIAASRIRHVPGPAS